MKKPGVTIRAAPWYVPWMFRNQPHSLTGASGEQYVFTLLAKSDPLPDSGGLLLASYTHPRGHLAGFEVHPLLLTHGPDLRRALPEGGPRDCVLRECWNSTGVLAEDDPARREAILNDLGTLLDLPCRASED